jgi:hypothetical protein
MFIHHNDFIVWRNGNEMVVAKFRIVGEVQRADGGIRQIPQPEFWDTSRNTDPTLRVLTSVQFQLIGIEPEELAMLEVNVATNMGKNVEHFRSGWDENVYMIEYSTRWPMTVLVKNFLTNHETVFEVRWERKPHATVSGEYIFWFQVEKYEKSLKDIKSHLALKSDNGGNGHGEQPSIAGPDPDDTAGSQLDHGTEKNGGRHPKRHHAEVQTS